MRTVAPQKSAFHSPENSSPAGDAAVVDLLRTEERLGIAELASRLGVTATAVRLRLERLMRLGLVERVVVPAAVSGGDGKRRRGRPSHSYLLTEKGRHSGGDNFRDLAFVLWREIRAVRDPGIRQGLIARIGAALAGMYRETVAGRAGATRLERVADLLRGKNVACGVQPASASTGGLPVLTSYSCPYPELAEEDRGICAAERLMLQELLEASVQLSACRLDGESWCQFTVGTAPRDDTPFAVPPPAGACTESS